MESHVVGLRGVGSPEIAHYDSTSSHYLLLVIEICLCKNDIIVQCIHYEDRQLQTLICFLIHEGLY